MSLLGWWFLVVFGALGAATGIGTRALLTSNRQPSMGLSVSVGVVAAAAGWFLSGLLGVFFLYAVPISFAACVGAVLLVGWCMPVRSVGKPKAAGIGKAAALILIMCLVVASTAFLVLFPPSFDIDSFEFWVYASMGIVAVGAQIMFLLEMTRSWDSMLSSEQGILTAKAVFLPPLIGVLSFVGVILALVALVAWMFAVGSGSGGPGGYGGGSSSREVKDRYGNRLGSLNTGTGEVKDRYGNRTGSINPHTGEVKDRYGNRTGWLE